LAYLYVSTNFGDGELRKIINGSWRYITRYYRVCVPSWSTRKYGSMTHMAMVGANRVTGVDTLTQQPRFFPCSEGGTCLIC